MESRVFQFNKNFYRQTFSTPIGSPIFSILTDLVMQDLETDIFQEIDYQIPIKI